MVVYPLRELGRVIGAALVLIRLPSVRKTPFQNLVVRPADQHPLDYCRIFDVQESANSQIRACPMLVVRRQLALRVQSNLIEHPPKKDDASNLLGGMSQTGNLHKCSASPFIRLLLRRASAIT